MSSHYTAFMLSIMCYLVIFHGTSDNYLCFVAIADIIDLTKESDDDDVTEKEFDSRILSLKANFSSDSDDSSDEQTSSR